jgi:hypothetical protein
MYAFDNYEIYVVLMISQICETLSPNTLNFISDYLQIKHLYGLLLKSVTLQSLKSQSMRTLQLNFNVQLIAIQVLPLRY